MTLTAVRGNAACRTRKLLSAAAMLAALLLAPVAPLAFGAPANGAEQAAGTTPASGVDSGNGVELLKQFDAEQNERVNGESKLSDHFKRIIMFSMSVPLFILLLITGSLGIATGVYGKKLYIQHMVAAGLTVSLALAHAIAGIVWFFPF